MSSTQASPRHVRTGDCASLQERIREGLMGRPFRPQEMLEMALFRGRRAPAWQSSGPLGLRTEASEFRPQCRLQQYRSRLFLQNASLRCFSSLSDPQLRIVTRVGCHPKLSWPAPNRDDYRTAGNRPPRSINASDNPVPRTGRITASFIMPL